MMEQVMEALAPVLNQLRQTVQRATVTRIKAATAAGKGVFQLVQLRTALGEDTDPSVEHVQPYGFASHVKGDGQAEALLINLGGVAEIPVVIVASDSRYTVDLAEGEVAVFDDQGQVVHIKRDRIEVDGQIVDIKVGGQLVASFGDSTGVGATKGAVNGEAVDPYTGQTQTALGNASTDVFVK